MFVSILIYSIFSFVIQIYISSYNYKSFKEKKFKIIFKKKNQSTFLLFLKFCLSFLQNNSSLITMQRSSKKMIIQMS